MRFVIKLESWQCQIHLFCLVMQHAVAIGCKGKCNLVGGMEVQYWVCAFSRSISIHKP